MTRMVVISRLRGKPNPVILLLLIPRDRVDEEGLRETHKGRMVASLLQERGKEPHTPLCLSLRALKGGRMKK
jgi:hypothetical protein